MLKNKQKTVTQKFIDATRQTGFILMAAATTAGVMDMQEHQGVKVVVPNQPTFAFGTNNTEPNSPIQREREEVGPHYINYSVSQRTPSRHGKR